MDSNGTVVGTGRIDQPQSTGRALIWSPEGELLPADRIPVRPNWGSGSMALFDAQVYIRASSEDFRETELWRIDLRSGLSTKLPLPDERLHLIAPNGWMVAESQQRLVLAAAGARVSLPDIEGHQRGVPGLLTVSNLGFMSWDGKTIGGYQSVPKGVADAQMEDIVAVVWHCQ